jgi:flagellar biosynthesis component FlhA
MSASDPTSTMAPLSIRLDLDPYVHREIVATGAMDHLVGSVTADAQKLLHTLGIPAIPVVELGTLEKPLPSSQPLRLSVNASRCRYSDELVNTVFSAMTGRWTLATQGVRDDIWTNVIASRPEDFMAVLCREVIKEQPEVLWDVPQASMYLGRLPTAIRSRDGRAPSEWLAHVLERVLSLHISISDTETVSTVLAREAGRATEDIVEALVAALRPEPMRIQFPAAYLRELTTSSNPDATTLFAFMRQGLFSELGVPYPALAFETTDELPQRTFSVVINHVSSAPIIGLGANELAAGILPWMVRQSLGPELWRNPANGADASLFCSPEHFAQLKAEMPGLTTWDSIQFVILAIAAVIREHQAMFVDRTVISNLLEPLDKWVYPNLIEHLRETASLEQLTRLVRELVREQVSVRNLARVIDLMVEFADSESAAEALSADSAEHQVEFVRAGLSWEITRRASRGNLSVTSLLVGEDIENILMSGPLKEQDQDDILAALRGELSYVVRGAPIALLTSRRARRPLRNAIAAEFPRVPVLAYDEVRADVALEPAGRVSLAVPA